MSKTAMTSEAAEWGGQRMCPLGDRHVHRDEVRQIIRECQEESFWYRALPLSLGSIAITGALLYNGVLHPSKRFGPFPKLAVAAQDSGGASIRNTGGSVTTCARSVKRTRHPRLQRENRAEEMQL
ncbi:hypothetical protein MATL_G00038770 [Megalops atlanticus]|uniref:OCIA domain-containing protein n=1 Tax=Megalops atlanticus TaxID=7932 RepID=A0A9D3QJM4_MEGAT|nr:hypothetical protein MATL_G00038770 [Megalops atlanticus]